MHVYRIKRHTNSLTLTFVFLLQVSLGEREQADLHRQYPDLPTATTADNTTETPSRQWKLVTFTVAVCFWVYIQFKCSEIISDLNYMQQQRHKTIMCLERKGLRAGRCELFVLFSPECAQMVFRVRRWLVYSVWVHTWLCREYCMFWREQIILTHEICS